LVGVHGIDIEDQRVIVDIEFYGTRAERILENVTGQAQQDEDKNPGRSFRFHLTPSLYARTIQVRISSPGGGFAEATGMYRSESVRPRLSARATNRKIRPVNYREKLKVVRDTRKPVYIFTGEEDYLIDRAVELVQEGVQAGFKEIFYVDKTFDPGEVIRNAGATDLFGQKVLPVVKDASKIRKKDVMLRLLTAPWTNETPFVLCAESLRLPKDAKKIDALAVAFDPITDKELFNWLIKKFGRREVKLDPKGLRRVLDLLPPRMSKSYNEIQKILLLTENLDSEEAERAVSLYEDADLNRFALKALEGNAKAALEEALPLLRSDSYLPLLSSSLALAALRLLEYRSGASKWGGRRSKQMSTYTQARLANALSTAIEADRAIKTDNVNRTLNFEKFLTEFLSEVRE
jgi:DNA polymerase III delta subunit